MDSECKSRVRFTVAFTFHSIQVIKGKLRSNASDQTVVYWSWAIDPVTSQSLKLKSLIIICETQPWLQVHLLHFVHHISMQAKIASVHLSLNFVEDVLQCSRKLFLACWTF